MPNKNVPNGFYMFMQEEKEKLKKQTGRTPSMHEMPAICKDTWKTLSAAEKAHYDSLAKGEKARRRGGNDKDRYRKDNQNQIIAYRSDPHMEKEKRRQQQTQTMIKSWVDQDPLDIVFHVIDFQVMYDERKEDHHLPVELGMVSFTLREGLQKFLHTFINPGDAPQGNRHLAQQHSDNTHRIPINYEKGDNNYRGIWQKIENFLIDQDSDDVPPVYCLSDSTEIVESCLDFIYTMASTMEANRIYKIYCMEDLVTSLIMQSGKTQRKPALSQIHDALRQNIWDYTSSIRCSFHEEEDCSHCSLSIVRRYSFAAFDLLSDLLEFTLTKNHVPEEPQQQFTILPPESFGRGFNRSNRRQNYQNQAQGGRGFQRGFNRADSPGSGSQSPQPVGQRAARGGGSTAAPFPPQVGRFEIQLSDSEEDNSDYDDDDVEPEAMYTPEVRSTSNQYQLKELRKPKTPSMLQSVSAGASGDQMMMMGAGRGRGIPPVTLRGQGGDAPSLTPASLYGLGQSSTASGPGVAPPPGFPVLARPILQPGSSLASLQAVNPGTAPAPIRPLAGAGRDIAAYSQITAGAPGVGRGFTSAEALGRGRSRGRGLPPQI